MTMQANPQYADVIAGKCRDFIYSDDDSSSISTHGTGANIDQFELKNKIEGTESKYLFFPNHVNTDDQWRMSLGTCRPSDVVSCPAFDSL
jgi:hypothetical protein